MINNFLKHQWLQFRRSSAYERELGFTIFIWFVMLMVLVSFASLAIALPKIIYEIPGIADPIKFINQLLIYYFFGELLMRYFMQKTPVMDIEPYMNLPIKRKNITNFLLGKSLLSLYTIFSLLFFTPFAVEILLPKYGIVGISGWLTSIFSISLALHFFNILFKKKLDDMPIVWAILIGLAVGNYVLVNYYETDFFAPLTNGMHAILGTPLLFFIPLAIALALSVVTYNYFVANLYLEEIGDKESANVENYSEKLSFLGKTSLSNLLILQEIKMILRHKRTRSVLFISLVFVGYGLMFFGRDSYSNNKGFLVFVGIFMSGLFTINYGQFFWSWNTNQMDFFFTRPLAIKTWLLSRYNLILISCIVTTILCIPYVYFGWEVLLLIFTGTVYNIGINIPLMMRLSMWGPKPIDLNKGAFMNYQGTGAAQWLMGIPLLAGPYLFYVPFNMLFGHYAGLGAVAFAGIIGFTLRDYFFNLIIKKLKKMKYKLIHDLTI